MTGEYLAICVPNPASQNLPFPKVAWDLLQTEGSGSEWKSKYPEMILRSLILQTVAIQGPDKLCLIPCVFFWLHPELSFLD